MDRYYGSANQSEYFRILDSTTFLPKTGLAYNSAGALAYYLRTRGLPVAVTLSALGAANAAFAAGGFIEVDSVNLPGVYRLDAPDAAYLSGVAGVTIALTFTGAICEPLQFRLVESAITISNGQITAIAEAVWKLDLSSITGEARRSPLNGLRPMLNKTYITGVTMVVTKEDDISVAFTVAVSTASNALPITGLDPN